MNQFYANWLELARSTAIGRGLSWNPDFDDVTGKVAKTQRWGLNSAVGLPPDREIWMSNFGHLRRDIELLRKVSKCPKTNCEPPELMSEDWREFLQASISHELFIKQNKVSNASAHARAIRTISLCAGQTPPWELRPADLQQAYNVALLSGASGKLAMNLSMVAKVLFDANHLSEYCPLVTYAKPYESASALAGEKRVSRQKLREGNNYNVHAKRSELNERKSAEKLPETAAFWELVRIVFTERPKTFTDRIRFAVIKLQILTGLRIGEVVMIPEHCLRWKDYYAVDGRSAGELGGFSKSLSLRYFALKQGSQTGAQSRLVERYQEIPPHFADIIEDLVGEISEATAPLRARLKLQSTSGRLIPEYLPTALVSAAEMYTRIAGSVQISNRAISPDLKDSYLQDHNSELLNPIRAEQAAHYSTTSCKPVRQYWKSQKGAPPIRDQKGKIISGPIDRRCYFLVSEIEEFVKREMPTKLPDTSPFIATDGKPFYPHQLLFLQPSRALIEDRNGGIVDVTKYFSVGRLAADDIILQLSGKKSGLFDRYGETEDDKKLSLNTHSLRHLQNTELFRLGITDAMITKRYGRQSTAQSGAYDHRSLREQIIELELPPEASALPERLHDTAKLMLTGRMRGPIVEEFLEIQRESGDEEAFRYLAAEADGFHATPYGFCLSSFTVDPCPKHLECFNGCRNLSRTENPEEEHNLNKMLERMERHLHEAQRRPGNSPGIKNQIAHASTVIKNLKLAIAAKPGSQVFPNGHDLARPIDRPATVIDTAIRSQG
ncbi:hypothetical protein KUV75_02245 [Qipengyuania gaetbuli]|uniref:hypothetical protein n=1 Tax=Qipengyuania gaetbuli TaxID=266952 RepID=UPI001C998F3E|nr:hypothetical protein [Qipengyuania gaetbuli]MBY6013723.1 hypothetical protein [Qipengyuania gaetbuli]